MSIARTSPTALLVGLLIFLALAAGCGGNEEAREEGAQDPAPEQEPLRTDEESTEERAEARNENSGDEARTEDAVLEIGGDEGTEFSGSCTIGDETSEIEGQAPESFDYQLDGERLDCEINAEGDLEVVFTAENTRSVQQISGGTLNLTYEDGRISSSTSSTSGGGSSSSQVVSSQVVSSQSSSSSINISP